MGLVFGVPKSEQPIESFVIVDNSAGDAGSVGGAGFKIRKFSNIHSSRGSDIEYVSDPVNGDYFNIHSDGNYSINYVDGDNSNYVLGVSVDNPRTAGSFSSVDYKNLLFYIPLVGSNHDPSDSGVNLTGLPTQGSAVRFLKAGSKVRANIYTSVVSAISYPQWSRFCIQRVG